MFHLLVFVFIQFVCFLFNHLLVVVYFLCAGWVGLSINLFLFKIQCFLFNYYGDLISSVQKKNLPYSWDFQVPLYIYIWLRRYKDSYEPISIMECHESIERCSNHSGFLLKHGINLICQCSMFSLILLSILAFLGFGRTLQGKQTKTWRRQININKRRQHFCIVVPVVVAFF